MKRSLLLLIALIFTIPSIATGETEAAKGEFDNPYLIGETAEVIPDTGGAVNIILSEIITGDEAHEIAKDIKVYNQTLEDECVAAKFLLLSDEHKNDDSVYVMGYDCRFYDSNRISLSDTYVTPGIKLLRGTGDYFYVAWPVASDLHYVVFEDAVWFDVVQESVVVSD